MINSPYCKLSFPDIKYKRKHWQYKRRCKNKVHKSKEGKIPALYTAVQIFYKIGLEGMFVSGSVQPERYSTSKEGGILENPSFLQLALSQQFISLIHIFI